MPKSARLLLVVDDEPEMRELLAILAAEAFPGITVVHASGGDMALAKVRDMGPWTAVLADYRMPVMDGLELLGRMATAAPEARRVLMSSFDDPDLRQRAITSGAVHAIVRKSGDPGDLESELRAALAGAL